jgi:hypothetical protein
MTSPILHHGDSLDVLRAMPSASVDAIVTDPPYGLAFMGKRWDYDVPSVDLWAECLRVMKPGGHLLSFAGARTQHRMAVRIEDGGFEIRDMLAWVYGSGFTKGFNMKRTRLCECGGNALSYGHGNQEAEYGVRPLPDANLQAPEHDGSERGQVLHALMQEQGSPEHGPQGYVSANGRGGESSMEGRLVHRAGEGLPLGADAVAPESAQQRLCAGAHSGSGEDARSAADGDGGSAPREQGPRRQQAGEPARIRGSHGALDGGALPGRGSCARCGCIRKEFEGFSSSLKPALEPITLARAPFRGTVADNVQRHGTGALNIDGCRVGTSKRVPGSPRGAQSRIFGAYAAQTGSETGHDPNIGRWPANLIHDGSDEVEAVFPEGAYNKAGAFGVDDGDSGTKYGGGEGIPRNGRAVFGYGDRGSASRFFYCAKASKRERGEGNAHPTVKPLALMRYLVRLITPPGGIVLDPFMGSGTTALACREEGFGFVGIEREAEHIATARRRLAA